MQVGVRQILGGLVLAAGLVLSLGSFGTTGGSTDDQAKSDTWKSTAAPAPAASPVEPAAAPTATTPSPVPAGESAGGLGAAATTPPVSVPTGAGAAVVAAPPASPVAALPLVAEGEGLANLTRLTAESPAYWPVISTDGALLVYVVRGEREGTDLALKRNFGGQAVTRLTSFPGIEKQPALSPDGSQVAFASDQAGNFDIYVMSTQGGVARRQITSADADEELPDWSPDGRRIAYSSRSPQDGRWYVWVRELATGAPTLYGEGLYPRFSPDGRLILFQRPAPGADGLFALWTMDIEGASLTQLTTPTDRGAIQARWSADGRRIVYCSVAGDAARRYTLPLAEGARRYVSLTGGTHLWLMEADGRNPLQLTRHAADDWYPFWSKNDEIFFTTTRDGGTRIWKFAVPSSASRNAPSGG